jgi:hypothetical protein
VHLLLIIWCSGAFTLMMHKHIHNNSVLSKPYSKFDWVFPYILEPLMGHTWDSYYYHYVKAHHVEVTGLMTPQAQLDINGIHLSTSSITNSGSCFLAGSTYLTISYEKQSIIWHSG